MPLLALLFLSLLSIQAAAAPTIPLISGHTYNLSNEVDYLIDPTHDKSINDVIQSHNWQNNNSDNINFSFIKDALWLKFRAIAQQDGEWIVKIPFPLLDHIEVHAFINKTPQNIIITGDAYQFSTRPIDHPHFLFPYQLKQGEALEVFIKVDTSGASEVPIHILETESSDSDYDMMTMLQGWMNGILAVMLFYNMVIYTIVKDKLYLSYSLTIFSYLLMFAGYNGTGFQYFWPDNPEFNAPYFAFVTGLYQLTNCIFIILFLKLKENGGIIYRIFNTMLYVFFISFPLILIIPYKFIMLAYIILSLVLNTAGLSAGIYYSIRNDKSAMFFTVAWLLLIFSIMIGNFRGLGFLPVNWFTLYSYQIGVLIEIIVLSIALTQKLESDRIETIFNLKRYENLYNTTLSGQFTLDNHGAIKSANPAFCKMLGFENSEEVIKLSKSGNGSYFHVDKSLPDKTKNLLDKFTKAFDLETQLRTKSGDKKWFSVTIELIKGKDGKIESYQGSMIDIQERKENEDIKKRTIQERMIAMEHLVVGICHEINTPLGVSNTAISHLKDDIALLNNEFIKGELTKNAFHQHLEYENEVSQLIDENLDRINILIKSFKEISVLQKGYKYDTAGMCKILDNQLTYFYQDIDPENIKIDCQKPLDFMGYPNAIEDVITQIISNTIEHGFQDKNGKIEITATSKHDKIHLEIRDNGIGIQAKNIRDIFNPFYTTKRGDRGSIGLGLYQAYNIVTQLLEGSIDICNTKEGTVFTVIFPVHVKEKMNDTNIEMLGYTSH